MIDGKLPGRDDSRPHARPAVMRTLSSVAFMALLCLAMSPPAEAQRPGRRWRAAPPAPRAQSAPRPPQEPSAPAGTAAARRGSPQAGAQPKPVAAGGKDGKDGKRADGGTVSSAAPPGSAAPTPGTPPTAASAAASETLAWDGPAPFSEAWRADHPGAWRPEEGAGEIVLAGGGRVPTKADGSAVDVAQWTALDRASDTAVPRSVLQASAEEAIADAAVPPSELIVFPAADGGLPTATSSTPTPVGPAASAVSDGTVSVLVREGTGGANVDRSGGASATVSLAQEESASPWLPLGTFAAVPASADRTLAPHQFLELALHRDGTIRGNYFDAVSDAVQPVAGRFDRETGALSWRIGRGGAEFVTTAEGLAGGRGEATVRRGATERSWLLIGLP